MSRGISETYTALDLALDLAAEGFRVFPIIRDGKTPAIKDWRVLASYDPEKVGRLFSTHDPVLNTTRARDCNVGIATGIMRDGQLAVLDTDVKPNAAGVAARGRQSIAELDMLAPDEWLDTKVVDTPSGGDHRFFRTKRLIRNSASKIAPGLDIRGEGGYVVAEGSGVDGRFYVARGGQLRDMPDWLEAMSSDADTRQRDGTIADWEDTEPALEFARRYLIDEAPVAVMGAGGDETTLNVAMQVRDQGVSEQGCLDLMFAHWNERCMPDWEWEHLAVKVSNAYKYARDVPGNRDAATTFEPVVADTADALAEIQKLSPTATAAVVTPPRAKLFFEWARDAEPDLSAIGLIDDWLDQSSMSVVYGPSHVGKTFVAMGMAYAIATGTSWNGHKAVQGAVVYIAAEAGTSARKRVKALRLHHGLDDFPLALVPCSVDLLRPAGDSKALIELVADVSAAARFAEKSGMPVSLIVVDTLSRAIAGGNENGPEDMGALVKNLDRIRAVTEAHIMVVHHSGKDDAKGARGHSLLRAATDTEIELKPGLVSATKQRDMEQQPPVGFQLVSVPLGERPDGRPVTSAVAVFGAPRDPDFDEPPPVVLTGMAAFTVRALEMAIQEHGILVRGDMCVSNRQWRDKFKSLYKSDPPARNPSDPVMSQRMSQDPDLDDLFRKNKSRVMSQHVTEKKDIDQWFIPGRDMRDMTVT